jgi:hypothetical protein
MFFQTDSLFQTMSASPASTATNAAASNAASAVAASSSNTNAPSNNASSVTNSAKDASSGGAANAPAQVVAAPSQIQSTIPVNTARNLNNNLYDKRKLGGLEIEQLIRELHANGDRVRFFFFFFFFFFAV